MPTEDTESFDLIQDRGISNEKLGMRNERKFYQGCRVNSFELRILRGEAIKLKLDITSEFPPVVYPYKDTFNKESGERFSGDCVTYKINGQEFKNIYGITLVSKKAGGTKTEIWIKRALEYDCHASQGLEIPAVIEDMVITAQLLRDTYEYRQFGMFRITLKRLVLVSDETEINAVDTVIGPLRYYVSNGVMTDVFTSGEQLA
jgi:hypothetical protein